MIFASWKELKIMSQEQMPPVSDRKEPVVEELKVQARDLVQAIQDIIHEGTARRVIVSRGGRTLVDLPLAIGLGAGALLAIYMPLVTAIVGVVALLGGATVRVERDDVPPSA
jgi:hypothetical protein